MVVVESSREFDLKPDPRILPMLGEITLPQDRCLAELIDNAVDGFLNAKRAGMPVGDLEISINVPMRNLPEAKITITDNGPGMDADTLEQAMRAGWSGNDPINNLGLFGMGFNIATARLGRVTRVWTARAEATEWIGLEIDFARMARQRHYLTPKLTRPKTDPLEHGTEIRIEALKPEQRQWFAKASNLTQLHKDLGRMYSAMLRHNGVPVSFKLKLNGHTVQGREHCVWGDEHSPVRTADTARYGTVAAFQTIDCSLGDKLYCIACMQWLGPDDEICPVCLSATDVRARPRRIHGWLGIQRYLSKSDFGIDLLRNGRKIEVANKDLFVWKNGDALETEYPIDDPRQRGRIVGEIHIDHCRVNYTKDRFERADHTWEEMVRVVRGDGPLQPDKAAALGVPKNESPLSLLFQAFRRSTPKPKVSGGWRRLLIFDDNDKAEAMAKRFHADDPMYQSDEKWWELVLEEDRKLLLAADVAGAGTATNGTSGGLTGFGAPPPGQGGQAPDGTAATPGGVPAGPGTTAPPPPRRLPLPALNDRYRDDITGRTFDVLAYQVEVGDPDLKGSDPWMLKSLANGPFEFLVLTDHAVFQSATMTPLDALLAQLAWQAIDLRRTDPTLTFASVLASLRAKYAGVHKLDPVDLAGEARLALRDIARSLPRNIVAGDGPGLFAELTLDEQRAVYDRMATRPESNPQQAIAEGRFLEYAPNQTLARFFERHPELFLDGRYWDVAYDALDYVNATVTDEARARVVREYAHLIAETIWLSDQDAGDATPSSRARLQRAALAVDLLSSNLREASL